MTSHSEQAAKINKAWDTLAKERGMRHENVKTAKVAIAKALKELPQGIKITLNNIEYMIKQMYPNKNGVFNASAQRKVLIAGKQVIDVENDYFESTGQFAPMKYKFSMHSEVALSYATTEQFLEVYSKLDQIIIAISKAYFNPIIEPSQGEVIAVNGSRRENPLNDVERRVKITE